MSPNGEATTSFFPAFRSVTVTGVTMKVQPAPLTAVEMGGIWGMLATSRTTSALSPSSSASPVHPAATSTTAATSTFQFRPFLARIVQPPLTDPHDLRSDEDQELTVFVGDVASLEEPAEHANLPEPGHARLALGLVHGEDPADHGRAAVAHEELGLGALRVDG